MASLAIQSRHWNLGGDGGQQGWGRAQQKQDGSHLPSLTHHPTPGLLAPRQACLPAFAITMPSSAAPSLAHLPAQPLQISSISTSPGQSTLSPPSPQNLPPPPPRPVLLCQELWKPWEWRSGRLRQPGFKCLPSSRPWDELVPLQSFGFFTCKRASSSDLPEGVGPECRVWGCECRPGGLGLLGPP